MVAQPVGASAPTSPPATAAEPAASTMPAPTTAPTASREVSAGGGGTVRASARPAGSSPAVARPAARPAPSAAAHGANSCKIAGEGDSPVDKACNEGGITAAKQAMKGMLKAGRSVGVKHECDDCHINSEDYSQLSSGADDRFAKLLAATRGK